MSPAVDYDEVCILAQNLARNCGYHVFPCRSAPNNPKRDKIPTTPNGFKNASNDPGAIAELWRLYPGALIGVAAGDLSDVDILDVDVKHESAKAWFIRARERIPPTRTFKTRKGGYHLLFKHAPGVVNSESSIALGIDTRGEGGYFIYWFAAGFACVDHSPVVEWPEWLLETLFYKPEPTPIPAIGKRFKSDGRGVQNLVESQLRKLANAPEGLRHATLRAASVTLGGVLAASGMNSAEAARLLFDAVLQAGGPRVDQANALATINWGLRKGAASPLEIR